jgi:hypothetical protein
MSLIVIAFLLPALAAFILWKFNSGLASIICASIPLGILVYFIIGILIPRIIEFGRFYSFPFGGFKTGGSDWGIIISGVFWIAASFLTLLF